MATIEQLEKALIAADKAGAADDARVLAAEIVRMRSQGGAPAAPEKPLAQQADEAIRQAPRQVGLFARSTLEGAPAILDTLASPFRAATEIATGRRVTTASGEGGYGSKLADLIGLPTAQTSNERAVAEGVRGGMSAATGAGVAQAGARVLQGATSATPTAARNVLEMLAANPGTQVAAGTSGGLAGGSVREAGGGAGEQFVASLAGGVAGGVAANKLAGAADAAKRALAPKSVQIQQADREIALTLERQGVDWSQLPERIKQPMREEAAQALATGGRLNPDALRRLLVFQRTGATPTVGMLTQDPGQITREMNLAKTGANSTDASLQRLPGLQNTNTARLLQNLDDAGAANAPGAYEAGRRVIGSLDAQAARAKSEIDALYGAARDTAGRSADLDPYAFTKRANELLDEALLGSKLPPDVANVMNWIAAGKKPVGMHGSVPMPFNVDIAEQLKTRIGDLQRSAQDGQVRKALSIVRQALDETPLRAAPQVNPGNLPAVPGTVPPSPAALGQESIDAFNTARAANRSWMQRVESNPALKAVVDGVEPDQFVQRYVIGRGATAADMRALSSELDPQALQSVKQYLVRYLRDAATGSTDDITKFSNAAYRRALRDLGDEKLSAFFAPAELQRLKDVGAAAKYMQAQPAGAAVNNSNSGALMLGRGLDWLDSVAGKLPLGGRDVIRGVVQGAQQTQVLSPRNALLMAADPASKPMRINPLLAAAAASPVPRRDDDRRKK